MQHNTSFSWAGVFRAPAQTAPFRSAHIMTMLLRRRVSCKPSPQRTQIMPGGAGACRLPAEPKPTIVQQPKAAALQSLFQRWVRRLMSRSERCLKLVCDATGITVGFCRARHQGHQLLYRVEFGGGYVRHCQICGCSTYVQR